MEYCRENKKEAALDDKLPTVADMAGHIRGHYHHLTNSYGSAESSSEVRKLQEEGETILSELLIIAACLDFSDHIGNQEMCETISKYFRVS